MAVVYEKERCYCIHPWQGKLLATVVVLKLVDEDPERLFDIWVCTVEQFIKLMTKATRFTWVSEFLK